MLQARPKKSAAARARNTVQAKTIVKAAAPALARATKTPKPAARKASTAPRAPSHDEIASRAHALYVQSGCASGRDEEFWLEAERQLLAERK